MDELKNYLMLDPICRLILNTFRSDNCSSQPCEVVEMEVSLWIRGSLKMSFLSVPLICEPVHFLCCQHLQGASISGVFGLLTRG